MFGRIHVGSQPSGPGVFFVGRLLTINSVSLLFCRTVQLCISSLLAFLFLVVLVICIFQSICPFHLIYEYKIVNNGLLLCCYTTCNEALFLFLILVICVFFYFLVWLARGLTVLIDLFKIPVF